jgi:hypothetical protein
MSTLDDVRFALKLRRESGELSESDFAVQAAALGAEIAATESD